MMTIVKMMCALSSIHLGGSKSYLEANKQNNLEVIIGMVRAEARQEPGDRQQIIPSALIQAI